MHPLEQTPIFQKVLEQTHQWEKEQRRSCGGTLAILAAYVGLQIYLTQYLSAVIMGAIVTVGISILIKYLRPSRPDLAKLTRILIEHDPKKVDIKLYCPQKVRLKVRDFKLADQFLAELRKAFPTIPYEEKGVHKKQIEFEV